MSYPPNKPFLNTPPSFNPSSYSPPTYSSQNQGSGFRPPSYSIPKFAPPPALSMPKNFSPTSIQFNSSKSPSSISSTSMHYRPPLNASPVPTWSNSGMGSREIVSLKTPQLSGFQSSSSFSGLKFNNDFSLSPIKNTFSGPTFQARMESTWRRVDNDSFSPSLPLYTQQEYMLQNSLEVFNRSNAFAIDRLGNQMEPSLPHSFIYQQTIDTVNSLNGQITSFSGKIGNLAFEVFTPTTNQNRLWTLEGKPLTSDPQVSKMMENTWRQVHHGSFSPEYPVWTVSAHSLDALIQKAFEKMNINDNSLQGKQSRAITVAEDSKPLVPIKRDVPTHNIKKSTVCGVFHGTIDFVLNSFHDLQMSAAYIGSSELEINLYEKAQILGIIEQSQAHRTQRVGNMVMNMLSIEASDAVYQSYRFKTTMTLDIASLVAGGYGAVKGIVGFNRLVKMPMQVAKLTNHLGKPSLIKAERTIKKLETFLGKDSKIFKNSHGDLLIESKDGLRQFRMDLNHPAPHKNPHTHLIEYEMRKNRKFEIINERIYPIDISPE